MPFSLKDRVALVTGSSSGIGQATAIWLARAGADLAIHYNRDEAGAQETARQVRAAGARATIIQANLMQPEDAERLVADAVAAYGKLNIVVNSAGDIRERMPLHQTPLEVWDYLMTINLKAAFLVSKASFPFLAAAGPAGRLINVSSAAAYEGGRGGDGVYGAAKAAVNALTKAFAKELAPHRATANILCPGPVETPMLAANPPEIIEMFRAKLPLGYGKPDDLAAGALFLASDEARWVSGAILDMNGGINMP